MEKKIIEKTNKNINLKHSNNNFYLIILFLCGESQYQP